MDEARYFGGPVLVESRRSRAIIFGDTIVPKPCAQFFQHHTHIGNER